MDKQFHMLSEYYIYLWSIFVFSEMFIKPYWKCFQQKVSVWILLFLFYIVRHALLFQMPHLKFKPNYNKTTSPLSNMQGYISLEVTGTICFCILMIFGELILKERL